MDMLLRREAGSSSDVAVLACSCLTRLGQWGNQLFQYAFLRVIADANGHRIACPRWLGDAVFGLNHDELMGGLEMLPLVADRVVLSHPGWRRWAATREPLRTMIAHQGDGQAQLSGRKLRADFPQVSGESLNEPRECAASTGSCDLWGWFQFHTSVWSVHRQLWGELYSIRPELRDALFDLLRRLVGCAPSAAPLLVIHLRCGGSNSRRASGSTETVDATKAAGASDVPHAPSWMHDDWQDRDTFWPTPSEWYLRWLESCAGAEWWPSSAARGEEDAVPRVLICSDDDAAAQSLHTAAERRLAGCPCRFVAWDDVDGSEEMAAVRRAWAAAVGADESAMAQLGLVRDWWTMTQADRLATSNSTFSFTAAMLSKWCRNDETTSAEQQSAGPAGTPQRFWRPVPASLAMEPFDPWDASPLLRCTDESRDLLYRDRGAYE